MSSNGPTFTKATYDKKRSPHPASSPQQRKAATEQTARTCADIKLMSTDKRAWLIKKGLLKP